MELEDEVSEAENDQSHNTKNDNVIAPSHVAVNRAAWFPRSIACGQRRVATPLGSRAESNGRRSNDTDWLPHGEKSNKVTALLRQEFESNGGIDRDVASKTERGKEVNSAKGAIVVLRSSLSFC